MLPTAAPAGRLALGPALTMAALASLLLPTSADTSSLVSEIVEAVSGFDPPCPVSIAEVSPAALREAVRDALWRRAVPVLSSLPPLPPPAITTLLLAGPLEHVRTAYQRLSRRPAAGSRHLRWLLAVPMAAQQARPALQPVLRESRHAMLLACVNASCARLAATSPGHGGVRLVEWPAGQPPPDWRLRQLGGRTLRVLSPMRKTLPNACNAPTIAAYRTPDGEMRLCGYLGQVLNIIAEKLNFQMEIIRKSGCGKTKSDGTMDGRPSWLMAGKADLGAGTCTVDVQRSTAVYMGEWFWSDTTSIATAQPGHWHSDFLVFGVLTEPIWAVVAVYILLFALLLRLTEKAGHAVRGWVVGGGFCDGSRGGPHGGPRGGPHGGPRGGPRGDPRDGPMRGPRDEPRGTRRSTSSVATGRHAVASLVDYTQQSVRMFLGQGDDVSSALTATRLLMIFVYMTTLTLMAIYSGNLTAFFSIRRESTAIDSLEDLAESSLEPHVTHGQSHYYIFENATSGARGQIWRKMQACDDCIHDHYTTTTTMDFVAGLVRGERALFQSQRALLTRADKYLAHTNQPASALCPLRLARQALRRDFYSLQFPHYSQYSALFDRAIRQLRYQGVIQRIFSQVAANKCMRTATPHHEVTPLDLHQMAGAFYVWAAGLGAALLVWVLEWCRGGSCCQPAGGRKKKGAVAENGDGPAVPAELPSLFA